MMIENFYCFYETYALFCLNSSFHKKFYQSLSSWFWKGYLVYIIKLFSIHTDIYIWNTKKVFKSIFKFYFMNKKL